MTRHIGSKTCFIIRSYSCLPTVCACHSSMNQTRTQNNEKDKPLLFFKSKPAAVQLYLIRHHLDPLASVSISQLLQMQISNATYIHQQSRFNRPLFIHFLYDLRFPTCFNIVIYYTFSLTIISSLDGGGTVHGSVNNALLTFVFQTS